MGRMMPFECEHGRVLDWGDFGPDSDDGTVGTETCPTCEAGAPTSTLRERLRRAVRWGR